MRFILLLLAFVTLGVTFAVPSTSTSVDQVQMSETTWTIELEITEETTLKDVNSFWGLSLDRLPIAGEVIVFTTTQQASPCCITQGLVLVRIQAT
jgi:hypothetical protein